MIYCYNMFKYKQLNLNIIYINSCLSNIISCSISLCLLIVFLNFKDLLLFYYYEVIYLIFGENFSILYPLFVCEILSI